MSDLRSQEVPVTSAIATKSLPGWRYAYYGLCLLFGAFWMIFVAGALWIGYRKDPVLGRIHRLGLILAVVSTVFIVATTLYVGMAANHALTNTATASSPSVNSDAPTDGPATSATASDSSAALDLPTESINDSPEQVINYMYGILAKGYQHQDARYFDHYNASHDDLYAMEVSYIGRERIESVNISDVKVTKNSSTEFEATYTIQRDAFPAHRLTSTYAFNGQEWRLVKTGPS